jgi:hypothetical protein
VLSDEVPLTASAAPLPRDRSRIQKPQLACANEGRVCDSKRSRTQFNESHLQSYGHRQCARRPTRWWYTHVVYTVHACAINRKQRSPLHSERRRSGAPPNNCAQTQSLRIPEVDHSLVHLIHHSHLRRTHLSHRRPRRIDAAPCDSHSPAPSRPRASSI